MDEEQKIRNELFGKYRDDILRRQLSNNENYDKAVLSLGTAFLGFSMAFLKDFVAYKNSEFPLFLPISWILFCLSIIATVSSFFISQKGLSTQLEYAENYYLKHDDSYLNKPNKAAKWTHRVNILSAILFILAIITTIFFVVANLKNGGNMPGKNAHSVAQEAKVTPLAQQDNRGASIPSMQQVPGGIGSATAGADVPIMQTAPGVSPSGQTSQGSQSGSSQNNSGANTPSASPSSTNSGGK